MFNIAEFLQKFKKIASDNADLRLALQDSIFIACGTTVPTEKIEIKGDTARVIVSGPLKTEVALKKEKILSLYKEKTGRNLSRIF